MTLSIIIPMYNVENYISQCIDSILNQQLPENEYEIIIIDDGSTDNSFTIATQFSSQHRNINVYHQENKGVSATRNRAIAMAKGTYLWFIDSDDYIASNTAPRLLAFIAQHNLDILEVKMIRTSSRSLQLSRNNTISDADIKILNGGEYVATKNFNDSTCTYIYNREFLKKSKVTFIENRIMEDMIFIAELIPKANKIAYHPLDVYRYAITPNSIWTSREPKAFRKSIDDFIFMTIKYSEIIQQVEKQHINTSVLKLKQQNMLYNIAKRLLKSDYTFSEIRQTLKVLAANNLYPLVPFTGKDFSRKLVIFAFNRKIIFFGTMLGYRIFKLPIENLIVKSHQNKRERQLNHSSLNS